MKCLCYIRINLSLLFTMSLRKIYQIFLQNIDLIDHFEKQLCYFCGCQYCRMSCKYLVITLHHKDPTCNETNNSFLNSITTALLIIQSFRRENFKYLGKHRIRLAFHKNTKQRRSVKRDTFAMRCGSGFSKLVGANFSFSLHTPPPPPSPLYPPPTHLLQSNYLIPHPPPSQNTQ